MKSPHWHGCFALALCQPDGRQRHERALMLDPASGVQYRDVVTAPGLHVSIETRNQVAAVGELDNAMLGALRRLSGSRHGISAG
jgi:hypothetical protein